jgi:hypothetical protein
MCKNKVRDNIASSGVKKDLVIQEDLKEVTEKIKSREVRNKPQYMDIDAYLETLKPNRNYDPKFNR